MLLTSLLLCLHSFQQFHRFQCLGRALSDSNSSINYFDFSVFSVIWGICFSLKANPNGTKNIAFWHAFGTGDAPASWVYLLRNRFPFVQNVHAEVCLTLRVHSTLSSGTNSLCRKQPKHMMRSQ